MTRRVAVTGLVSPLGCGVDLNWERLTNSESGSRAIQSFDVSDLPAKIAAQVPVGETFEGKFNADDWGPPKEQRRMDAFIVFALAATAQAVAASGWTPADDEERYRTGVLIGSRIGGLSEIARNALLAENGQTRRIGPFFIPAALINLASGHVSIMYGFKGPNHAMATACATGAHAIGDAARLIIMWDDADGMVAGGAGAAARALSTKFNDTPEKAARPWDRQRDGFVMGEGAGVLVLEELGHAKTRGAKTYAELVGFGMSGDAHNITAPAEDGNGAFRCMQATFRRANVNPDEIDHINAHGTSTPLGDEIELAAVKRLFGDASRGVSMASTKSSIGHLLGAAGAAEAIFSIQALWTGQLPPTLNLDDPSEGCDDFDLVPHATKERLVRAVLSNFRLRWDQRVADLPHAALRAAA
jgi:3-oxoacyl-(acyl-carrier-protein) synthase